MVDAARGFRLRNSSYRRLVERSEGLQVTENTASRDLRAMVEAGILEPRGERRGRLYVAGPPLRQAWQTVRGLRPRPARSTRPTSPLPDSQERLPGL